MESEMNRRNFLSYLGVKTAQGGLLVTGLDHLLSQEARAQDAQGTLRVVSPARFKTLELHPYSTQRGKQVAVAQPTVTIQGRQGNIDQAVAAGDYSGLVTLQNDRQIIVPARVAAGQRTELKLSLPDYFPNEAVDPAGNPVFASTADYITMFDAQGNDKSFWLVRQWTIEDQLRFNTGNFLGPYNSLPAARKTQAVTTWVEHQSQSRLPGDSARPVRNNDHGAHTGNQACDYSLFYVNFDTAPPSQHWRPNLPRQLRGYDKSDLSLTQLRRGQMGDPINTTDRTFRHRNVRAMILAGSNNGWTVDLPTPEQLAKAYTGGNWDATNKRVVGAFYAFGDNNNGTGQAHATYRTNLANNGITSLLPLNETAHLSPFGVPLAIESGAPQMIIRGTMQAGDRGFDVVEFGPRGLTQTTVANCNTRHKLVGATYVVERAPRQAQPQQQTPRQPRYF